MKLIRDGDLIINAANIEVIRKGSGNLVEVVMVSGRTYSFSGTALARKLLDFKRSCLFKLIRWIRRLFK